MPVTNIPVPGDPIRSNWAQSVSNVANANETAITTKVAKAGDTLTGDLVWGVHPESTGTGVLLRADSTWFITKAGGTREHLYMRRGPGWSPGETFIKFFVGAPPGTQAGTINSASGPGVTYGTTSDRRLKDEVGPIVDALERLIGLRPLQYRWKSDPDAGVFDGFFADEVAPLIPGAVSGEPDARTETGDIDPQQLDASRLVPVLVAAVQALAARVAALEGT